MAVVKIEIFTMALLAGLEGQITTNIGISIRPTMEQLDLSRNFGLATRKRLDGVE